MIIETLALIGAAIATAAVTCAVIAVVWVAFFTLYAVAAKIYEWIKTRKGGHGITIGGDALDNVLESLEESSPETAEKLEDALAGRNGKVVAYFDLEGNAEELQVLQAEDASVDELQDITRFDSDGRIRTF